MITGPAIDRRAALKARHRQAILEAARQLVEERGGPRFSVDELAARADIARRTVFNHFASLDEVLLALCGEALEVIIDDFIAAVAAAPVGDGSLAAVFDELADTLRHAQLTTVIASIARILGPQAVGDARGRALSDEAFARAGGALQREVSRRHPETDALDIELTVSSLMSGVVVIARHWIERTEARTDRAAQREWTTLLDRLLDHLRSGYAG